VKKERELKEWNLILKYYKKIESKADAKHIKVIKLIPLLKTIEMLDYAIQCKEEE